MPVEDVDFVKVGKIFDYFAPILQAKLEKEEEEQQAAAEEEMQQYAVVRGYCQRPDIKELVAKLNGS